MWRKLRMLPKQRNSMGQNFATVNTHRLNDVLCGLARIWQRTLTISFCGGKPRKLENWGPPNCFLISPNKPLIHRPNIIAIVIAHWCGVSSWKPLRGDHNPTIQDPDQTEWYSSSYRRLDGRLIQHVGPTTAKPSRCQITTLCCKGKRPVTTEGWFWNT